MQAGPIQPKCDTKTEQAVPLILEKIKDGYSANAACNSVGISYTTFRKYCLIHRIKYPKNRSIGSPWYSYKTARFKEPKCESK